MQEWGEVSLCVCQVTSVVSDSLRTYGLQPTRLPCPWDSLGKNTGVGCHFLLHMKVKYLLIVYPIYDELRSKIISPICDIKMLPPHVGHL